MGREKRQEEKRAVLGGGVLAGKRKAPRETREVSPPPSVHAHVADPRTEPAPLVVAASLGVTRGMATLG